MYKQKIQGLLEVLEGKLRMIENVSTGALKMSNAEVENLISQTKNIREQISELVRIERD
jgi:hypothetical protein